MKLLILNILLILCFDSNSSNIYDIKSYKLSDNLHNSYIYLYQDMKEVRYLYIDNLVEFDLKNLEVYAGFKKVDYIVLTDHVNIIDLNNYYPIDCLKFNVINDSYNNTHFNIKISNKLDFNVTEFAYGNFIIEPNSNISFTIKDFIITNPKWKKIKISNKKIEESYTKKMLKKVEIK